MSPRSARPPPRWHTQTAQGTRLGEVQPDLPLVRQPCAPPPPISPAAAAAQRRGARCVGASAQIQSPARARCGGRCTGARARIRGGGPGGGVGRGRAKCGDEDEPPEVVLNVQLLFPRLRSREALEAPEGVRRGLPARPPRMPRGTAPRPTVRPLWLDHPSAKTVSEYFHPSMPVRQNRAAVALVRKPPATRIGASRPNPPAGCAAAAAAVASASARGRMGAPNARRTRSSGPARLRGLAGSQCPRPVAALSR